MKLTDLTPDSQNARAHDERNVDMIVSSLEEVGAARSIVIDEDGTILAGNATVEAALKAGLKNVKVVETNGSTVIAVRRTGLTSEEKKRLALLDNRTAELATWDVEVLADIWREDETLLSGVFEQDELADILGDLLQPEPVADPGAQVDKAAELQEKWGTALGQVWEVGEHRIACGDCTDAVVVEVVMRGKKVEAVVTDPPYGIGHDTDYTRFTNDFGVRQVNYSKIEGDEKLFDPTPLLGFEKVVLWGANWYCKYIPVGSWLVWDKRHTTGSAILSDAEIAWMKGGTGVYIYSETVQGAIRKERATHPTQKPVGLFAWCIEKCKAGPVVYDPFLGSGTTAVACQQLDRKCRGVEIEPKYVAVTLERLSGMGLNPILTNG